MFKIDAAEARTFSEAIDSWLMAAHVRAVEVYRGISITMFNYVAWETPQWTGNAAANWNFSVGSEDFSVDSSLKEARSTADRLMGTAALSKGNITAVGIASSRNNGKDKAVVSLSVPVFITNAAQDLDGEVYARKLEDNPNDYLRPENRPGAMISRGLAKASMRFSLLSGEDVTSLVGLSFGDTSNAGLR